MKQSIANLLHKNAVYAVSGLMLLATSSVRAAPLNLAENALELRIGADPSVTVVLDDSGSMHWEAMTLAYDASGVVSGKDRDGNNNGDGSVATSTVNIVINGAASTLNACILASDITLQSGSWWSGYNRRTVRGHHIFGVAFDEGAQYSSYFFNPCAIAPHGNWRFRNHEFNQLYYNPARTYAPWPGENDDGDVYQELIDNGTWNIRNAPLNPWNPSDFIDLTTQDPLLTNEWTYSSTTGLWKPTGSKITGDGFRYYEWKDTDGDGYFDDTDNITAVYVKDMSADQQKNFLNWFVFWRSRGLVAKGGLTSSLEKRTNINVGIGGINNYSSGFTGNFEPVDLNPNPLAGNKKDLFDWIYAESLGGGTPLRRGLYAGGGYYDCSVARSSTNSLFGATSCPMTGVSGTCQQNYVILFTDGFYNGSFSSIGEEDSDVDSDFDGGTFGDSITLSPKYSSTLADIAMYYYENDLAPTLTNDVPVTTIDQSRYAKKSSGSTIDTSAVLADDAKLHQHVSTYTVGFGVNGQVTQNPDSVTSFGWDWNGDGTVDNQWPDPLSSDQNKIDDLRHAAWNGRGDFISAMDPNALTIAFDEFFNNIQQNVGAASSVSFNTQNLESETMLYRAIYNTETNSGELSAISLENLTNTATTISTNNPEWLASQKLEAQTPASRVIISYKRDSATGYVGGIPFTWADLSADQQQHLNETGTSLEPSCTSSGCYGSATNISVGDERLAYLRGDDTHEGDLFNAGEFRERPEPVNADQEAHGRKLGDIVHSTPVFIGEPQFVGRDIEPYPTGLGQLYSDFKKNPKGSSSGSSNRTEVVYVGANDGMLHAFRADKDGGNELFAYVPGEIYERLSDLTNPNYSHKMYVDLSPQANDVFTAGPSSASKAWRTMLVGGYRAGGKGYFALDVTDPDDFATETSAKDQVMWEFTVADDGGANSDLGHSYSEPQVAMTNAVDGTEQKWFVIFGNGYNATHPDGESVLYFLNVEGGLDGDWTDTGDFYKGKTGAGIASSSTSTPNGMGSPRLIDIDRNGTVDYVYVGDMQGYLYRYDLTDTNPANWSSVVLFQATDSAGNIQPITTTPLVFPHPTNSNEVVVVIGTGSWITETDSTDTNIQSLYGIWDYFPNGTPSRATRANNLVEQTFTNEVSKINGFTLRTLSNTTIAWKKNGSANSKVLGWYIDFDVPAAGSSGSTAEYPGERAIQLQTRGGILFVNTIFPRDTNTCEGVPGGFELAINPQTGGVPDRTVFDLNNDVSFTADDDLGSAIVAGKRFEAAPTPSSFLGSRRVTQLADTSIVITGTNTEGTGLTEGRLSWREIWSD